MPDLKQFLSLITTLGLCLFSQPHTACAADPLSLDNSQTSQAAVGRSGDLHTVRVAQTGDLYTIQYRIEAPSGLHNGPADLFIFQSSSRLRRPQIVLDSSDAVHILWQERFAKTKGARDVEGTWVHYVRLTMTESGHSPEIQHIVLNDRPKAKHPYLSVDPRGNALVVWEEEAGALVLAKVDGHKMVSERHALPSIAGADERAFPAATADANGNIHLAWTDPSTGETDRMVYAVLDSNGSHVIVPKQTVHKLPSALGLRKSVSVEPEGRVKLSWKAKHAEGPAGEIASDRNHLMIAPVKSRATQGIGTAVEAAHVADRHLHAVPNALSKLQDDVVLGKRVSFKAPDRMAAMVDRPFEPRTPSKALLTEDVQKSLKQEILEFSSWSGPPPSRGVADFLPSEHSPFQSSRHLSNPFISINRTSFVQSVLSFHSISITTELEKWHA